MPTTCSSRPAARATPRRSNLEAAGVEADKRGYVEVDEDYRTSVPAHLRGRRRHRLPRARVDVDGAGARRGVPRVRLHVQAPGRASSCRTASTRSPRCRCVGLSEEDAKRARASTWSSAAPFYATTRAARSSATHDGLVKLVFDADDPQAARRHMHRRARVGARAHRAGRSSVRRHGRHVHRDGLQLPDAARVLQIRGLRRARPAGTWPRAAPQTSGDRDVDVHTLHVMPGKVAEEDEHHGRSSTPLSAPAGRWPDRPGRKRSSACA